MQRSTKVILEAIDEQEAIFDNLRNRAKDIFERAKTKDRELTKSESMEFDSITDKKTGSIVAVKDRLSRLKRELAENQSAEYQLIQQARNPQGPSSMERRHPSGTVYNMMNSNAPERVLPVNGELPGEGKPRYSPLCRMAKLRAFRDEQSAFDSGQWLKAVVARTHFGTIDRRAEDYCNHIGFDIENASYEGSGTAGGYTVPAPVSSAIIEVRERVGVSRQIANVMPMTADTLSVPKRTGGLTVYVVNEMQAITDSTKNWGLVAVEAKKRACLSYLSQELSDDSLINMADNIFTEMGYALALQEDDELINGTGASSYGGIQGLLSAIGAGGVSTAAVSTTWAALTLAEVVTAMGLLPDRYYPYEPSWICSHSFFNQVFMRLAVTAGGVTLAEVMSGTPNVRSFLGYKVYLTSKMPVTTAVATKSALFGAFDQAVLLGDRGGIRVARSDDFKFSEDLISLKATSRYDMTCHDCGDASNPGAYVALATHA